MADGAATRRSRPCSGGGRRFRPGGPRLPGSRAGHLRAGGPGHLVHRAGFHFYVADLRSTGRAGRPRGGASARGRNRASASPGWNSACRHLREAEGIEMILMSAHGAGALTAAQWCDARRDDGLADALICPARCSGGDCAGASTSPARAGHEPGGEGEEETARPRGCGAATTGRRSGWPACDLVAARGRAGRDGRRRGRRPAELLRRDGSLARRLHVRKGPGSAALTAGRRCSPGRVSRRRSYPWPTMSETLG